MTDWAIPQQAKLKYTQLFNLHDRSRSGFLSGLQCRDILLQSGLPRNVLAEIWNLSDIDGDGQLTREEFILAMHLTNHVRSGQSLPTELPPDLVPPSYRRARSISSTSVHSATSVGSSAGVSGTGTGSNLNDDQTSQKSSENATTGTSFAAGSVLNSNSFEDKRRENFEKGRAELERRRLKIIEQQTGILREQLAASKKQVTEAKAKIDSMRSDRDTKMGLITSLEAQLKTIQDKKAYLNHEELSLIAIAKDLNLVNSAQAELDQLATQAKQQSIDEMKEQLVEFSKQKEAKTKELAEVAKRVEESKKELKTLSETVTKAYENYKEKIADAKVKRQQFIDENKTQTADLDSIWDAAPSFSPQANARLELTTTNTSITPVVATSTNTTFGTTDDPWATNNVTNAFSALSTDESSQNFPSKTSTIQNPISPKSTAESFGGNEFDGKISSFETTQASQSKRFRALYAFEARNPDELTINPGDIIIGSEAVCEPGWLSGESNGRVGLFPEAYVEPLSNETINNNTILGSSAEFASALEQASNQEPTLSGNNEPIQSNTSTHSPAIKYKVVHAFDARNPDELTINPGDIITGLEGAHEPGWLMGDLNGQKGLFPEAYVERMHEVIQADQPEVGKSRSKRADVATVIANYRALGQEQLNLEKGQLVLIRRKMDSGWWEGETQVKDFEFERKKGGSELDNLIGELIGSELDFVKDLKLCQIAYILPLSKSFNVSEIFIKWDELILMHEYSLKKISFVDLDLPIEPVNYKFIFETFQNLLSSIDALYIEFCSKQNESVRRFEAKLVSDIRFKQLVHECQRNLAKLAKHQVETGSNNDDFTRNSSTSSSLSQHQGDERTNSRLLRNYELPMTSYLLKPMQRITKYSLLFERLLKVVGSCGLKEFEPPVSNLRELAQSLCKKVNEACRIKEDDESNKRRLRWAQSHIRQTSHHNQQQQQQATEFIQQSQRYSLSNLDSRLSHEQSQDYDTKNEVIFFESNTNCMGKRKFVKSGSMIKNKSGKELVLFLFNDLLLLTQVKGVVNSPLRVEDVFQSIRAQQSYYKLYREPILTEDIIIQDASSNQLAMNQSFSSRSSWSEQQLLAVNFSCKSNGDVYNLLAMSYQQKIDWIRELSQQSVDAREVRLKHQAQKLARPMLRKPSVEHCLGRLFVTILEVGNLQNNLRLPQNKPIDILTTTGYHSPLILTREASFHDIGLTSRVCVQIQMKRLRMKTSSENETMTTSISQLNNGTGLEDSDIDKREMKPMSDVFKTSAFPINNENSISRISVSNLDGSILKEDNVVFFNEECTQFLIENKNNGDCADYLDIELLDDSKFRETQVIARRRINIDQLLGNTSEGLLYMGSLHRQTNISPSSENLSFSSGDLNQTVPRLQPNRPVELVFKMKPMNLNAPTIQAGGSQRVSSSRRSLTPERQSLCKKPNNKLPNHNINIKLRLHLQLFQ